MEGKDKASKPRVAVSFRGRSDLREPVEQVLGESCSITYLEDLPDNDRLEALERADALLSSNIAKELSPEELGRPVHAKLIQLLSAGVDHAPFSRLPKDVPVAHVPGAFSEPMAEHVAAMALAGAKRLFIEDRNMREGEFNQFAPNKLLKGCVCTILGLGGVGKATAGLLRCLGMKIYAINRSGKTDEPVDFIGTFSELEKALRAADVVVIALALTRDTEGLIGERELSWMKDDAILVNVARGEIINEAALYNHLKARPDFTACIESWWIEPLRHGEFRTNYPLLELPNVIACPHNSAAVPGWYANVVRTGAENVLRTLNGEAPMWIVPEDQRLK